MKRNFGISQNVKSRLVCTCTPELFREAVDSAAVASLCAEIADALEAVKRGELSREEFDILKADRKRLLPVITPHATFTAGRRVNAEAVPSGLCMLDADHLPDARGFYEANVRGREEALGILLAHITPSCEGLRLVFVLPDPSMELEAAQRWMAGRLGMKDREEALGILLAHITPSCEGLRLVFVLPDPSMELEAAQRWMAGRLGMKEYDGAVKDLARCSFLVPRDYFLYLNEEGLFGEADAPQQAGKSTAEDKPSETPSSATTIHKQTESPNLQNDLNEEGLFGEADAPQQAGKSTAEDKPSETPSSATTIHKQTESPNLQNENELKEKELKENTINENTIKIR